MHFAQVSIIQKQVGVQPTANLWAMLLLILGILSNLDYGTLAFHITFNLCLVKNLSKVHTKNYFGFTFSVSYFILSADWPVGFYFG